MGISCRKSAQKTSPRSLSNFGKQPKIAIAYKEFFKKRYIERVSSKSIKKLTLFFLSNSVPFNGQDYEKQKCLELVTSHSVGYKISSEKLFY